MHPEFPCMYDQECKSGTMKHEIHAVSYKSEFVIKSRKYSLKIKFQKSISDVLK